MPPSENPWVSVQLDPDMVIYLEVAVFNDPEIRSRSDYLRMLIEGDMLDHPDWVKQARERKRINA